MNLRPFFLAFLCCLALPAAAYSSEQAASTAPAAGSGAKLFQPDPVKTVKFGKFELRGTAKFAAKTRDALILLESATTFTDLAPYIAVIEESTSSGMAAWAEKPTFYVGMRTWGSDVAWYAGAIAHDACHSRLYHKAKKTAGKGRVPDKAWTGRKSEQDCLGVQAEVLTELKALKYFIDYVKGLIRDPTYQDVSYSSRTW